MSDGVRKDRTISYAGAGFREPEIRPRVAVSACLLGERVRYDGTHKRSPLVAEALAAEVELVGVCPEAELGLGVPRETIHIARLAAGGPRLLRSASGRELTAGMARFSASRIARLRAMGIAGYVLKARSPSCAVTDAPEVGPAGEVVGTGPGMFAAAVLKAFPGLPVIDESALATRAAVSRFVAAVRAYAGRHGPCNTG